MHPRRPARPPRGHALLAAAVAALALAGGGCRGPSRAVLRAVREEVAGCPVPLDDAALDDLATYARCTLPSSVARLVRNDYADDELSAPALEELARHGGEVTAAAFEAQLRRFVDPDGALAGWIAVDPARGLVRPDPVAAPGLSIPFAPPDPAAAAGWADGRGRLVPPPHPERPYRPARRDELGAAATPERPLAGLRVAIDPGHAGGAWGALEERRVVWRAPGGREVALEEGDLSLRTALELRAKLRARGAEVLLTREAPGPVHGLPLHAFRPFGERLLARIALDPDYARLEAALAPPERLRLHAALFLFAVKQHRYASLRARAELARAGRADLLVSVHYNAASPEGRAPEVLAMIRGAFAADRLYNPVHRRRALEAAFEVADFDAAAHLGAGCVAAMAARLRLPAAGEPRYEDHVAVRDARGHPLGVDAWDGALLRYLDVPAVLTEGPCYDAPEEEPRLAAALAAPLGTPGTRTERYADALAACVEGWARQWLTSEANPFGPFP